MSRISYLFLFILLLYKPLTGQPVYISGNGFQTSFSLGHSQFKEYLFNGLRNSGVNLEIGVNYNLRKKSLDHTFGLNIEASALWNRYGWISWYARPSLYYRLITPVSENLQIGGHLKYSSLFYENENLDSQHNYWITSLTTGFSIIFTQPLNTKWILQIPANLALFGFISRPAENRNLILNEPDLKFSDVLRRINSGYKFTMVSHKMIQFETGLLLRTAGKRMSFGYLCSYEQTQTSAKTQLFINRLVMQVPLSKSKE